MANKNGVNVTVTDVTLREYGQNLKKEHLDIFTPDIRSEIALNLIDAGFKSIEVFSCVNPQVAPSMNEVHLKKIISSLGKIDGVSLITLVPNKAGFDNFLHLNLGPDGYNHTIALFFSAVESHNLANLGRSINETIHEYKKISKEASSKNIRIIGYLSAAFGYLDPETHKMIKADVNDLTAYIDILFDLGSEIVTLSDLQGVADEIETKRLLEAILNKRKGKDIHRLGYHPHHTSDERALSNSMTAYDVGIRRFDASLGGTGGCVTGAPGNQPTELLVQKFTESGINTGIDGKKVINLAEQLKRKLYSKIEIA
jgi:hydroxymethylglutaryl-CoA lyase